MHAFILQQSSTSLMHLLDHNKTWKTTKCEERSACFQEIQYMPVLSYTKPQNLNGNIKTHFFTLFISETSVWGNNRSISFMSSHPCLLITTEPPPLPVTQSALTPREFLYAIYFFFLKETPAIFNLFDIKRGGLLSCVEVQGHAGMCALTSKTSDGVHFEARRWKCCVRQVQTESGCYFGEVHHKSFWRGHLCKFSGLLIFVLSSRT